MNQQVSPNPKAQQQNDVLNGWKDIARYIQRDVRTVERWEKQRGLPVRRVPGAGRATVYARISELEEWLSSRPLEGEINFPDAEGDTVPERLNRQPDAPAPLSADVPLDNTSTVAEMLDAPSVASTDAQDEPRVVPATKSRAVIPWPASAAAVLVALLVAGFAWKHYTALSARPQVSTRATVATPRAKSADVDELYLRGVYSLEARTPASLEDALADFSEATRRDPAYAPAYAGLGTTWVLLREYSSRPNAQCFEQGKAMAEHAIALNPDLPTPHATLAFIQYFWELQPRAAEQEFRRAVELDPNSALAHHWYGSMLTHEGRVKEALQQLDEAQHLQPTSSSILVSRALALGLAGDRERANQILTRVVDDNAAGRTSATAHRVMGFLSLQEPRDLSRFAEEGLRAAQLRHDATAVLFYQSFANGLRSGGSAAAWQAALRWSQAHPTNGTLVQAEALVSLNKPREALEALQGMTINSRGSLSSLMIDPVLRRIADTAEFQQLRISLDLP